MGKKCCETKCKCKCKKESSKDTACKTAKYLTIIGKPGQTFPDIKHPCQGQRWISSTYQIEYIFNKRKWHLVDPKPNCDKVLVDYVFAEHTVAEVLSDFNALTNFGGSDGTFSTNAEGLTLDASTFTFTIPSGNEHVKNLRYWNTPFVLSDDYEVLYETEMAAKQCIPVDSLPPEFARRIRNVNEDIRLCSAAMNTVDLETFTVFDIFFTNEKIYCLVERLPFGKTPTNNYAAYSAVVFASSRAGDALNDFVKVAIGLKKTTAAFYVNGINVFNVPRIGVRQADEYRVLDHKGAAQAISINSSYFGFGVFSLLDFQLQYDYARQAVYNDFDSTTDPNPGLNQSASGLVQLGPTADYGELLPGRLYGDGEFDPTLPCNKSNEAGRDIIDPAVTWGVTFDTNPPFNQDKKIFGQGAILRMKYFKVCIKY